MITLILLALLLIVGVAAAVKGSVTIDDEKTSIRGLALIPLALALVLACATSVYKIDTGDAGVVRNVDGTIAGEPTVTPGFKFKVPGQSVAKFDIRAQPITFVGDGNGDKVDGPRVTTATSDGATAGIDATILYSIDADKVSTIYTEFRDQDNLLTRKIIPAAKAEVGAVGSSFTASQIRQSRPAVAALIQKALNQRLAPYGISVDSVEIRDTALPGDVEAALNKVQQARAAAESARADLETAKITAERTKTEAQAASDSDQIIRCGATSTTIDEVVNGQTVKAVKVIPVPSEKCQNRLNEQVLTSKYIEALKEAGAKGNMIYVVPPNANQLLTLGTAK